ncbi:rab9 effector protein with kelch motifs-like [Iris pallida]|uniref:Rab9 effector protein with kelch motifs-like n=1 Tax=Iris pallida TaxID=29817 RepID=A0AAX6I334_IRIPA|nr:rab9 effector protein with kelch motifs-like [Iris pallida]
MGSLGGVEVVKRRKAMWLYPKVLGSNPPERWGHSACLCDGVIYVFGGCCGGMHFSDVLTLSLDTMSWNSLATTGQKPGTRDSHSAIVVGHKMVVLGGTNGSKKVNDLHILDLRTKEWSKPSCKGTPPSPRESHTATVVGDNKLVIFGGSGEGEANYLNDVHILDLKNMTWTSPEVKGDLPAPRDSHTAVEIDNKLVIYGGDCGDRYHGEVDILDMDTMTWSRLAVQGSSPGVRAGHAAVNIGVKVFIIGGVGDKQYYSDVWVLDMATCSWNQLDIRGQQPQGRFSHTAVVTNTDVAIYGGCGEDERPLNELLILQLGSEHPNGRYNISMCKVFRNHWSQEKRKFLRGPDSVQRSAVMMNGELNHRSCEPQTEPKMLPVLDNSHHAKRRRINDSKVWEVESEQEEHSLSLSQHSSPSQSDQEQNTAQKLTAPVKDSILPSQQFVHHKLHRRTSQELHLMGGESPRRAKTEQFLRVVPPSRPEVQFLAADLKMQMKPTAPHLIGAEVRGTVDGAFDSGYLMTANVNGQILRGVLFAPGPGIGIPRPPVLPQNPARGSPTAVCQQYSSPPHAIPIHVRPPPNLSSSECGHHTRQAHQVQVVKSQPTRLNSDLQGVVLTLGGPGGGSSGGS